MDGREDQFMSITGCDKVEVARFYLESSQNDVENAVNMYLENGGEAGNLTNLQSDEEVAADDVEDAPGEKPEVVVNARDRDEQRWYMGGGAGGSGQEVIAPGGTGAEKAKGFVEAMQAHARQGTAEDLEKKKGAFSGSSRTLDGQVRKAPKELKKVVVKFYDNEVFTVDDGPPRKLSDPGSMAFLDSIRRQECPVELQDGHQDVQVSLVQAGKDWEASEHKKSAFGGAGRRLTDVASTSATLAQLSAPVPVWDGPDDSKPITSIQLRFPDGSRLIGRFNYDQKVREIRSFVGAARPHDKALYVMLAGFPQRVIEDEEQSIADAALINAVVIFKVA